MTTPETYVPTHRSTAHVPTAVRRRNPVRRRTRRPRHVTTSTNGDPTAMFVSWDLNRGVGLNALTTGGRHGTPQREGQLGSAPVGPRDALRRRCPSRTPRRRPGG